jgi:hypothetical protein
VVDPPFPTNEVFTPSFAVVFVVLHVKNVVLEVKASVHDELEKFRKDIEEKYQTKELAHEQHGHVMERLNRLEKFGSGS